jgi:hypothetical protein
MPAPKERPYAYVIRSYGVPVTIGCRVSMGERKGTVVRKSHYDHYVHVRFDDIKHDVPVHPLDLTYEVSL